MIVVDDREPDLIINKIKNKKIERLKIGDYIVGNIVIERKIPSDFFHHPFPNKCKDRFWRQMEKMKNLDGYQPCIAVINGYSKSSLNYLSMKYRKDNTKLRMFRSIIQLYNVPLIQFRDIKEFTRFLNMCDREKICDLPIPIEKTKTEKKFESLALIDGVDLNISKELFNRFTTIKNIMLADKDDLKGIKGIGFKTANNIFEFFNNEVDEA